MNKTIYKYPLVPVLDLQAVDIPPGAKFLDCQLQNGGLVMWFEVDKSAPVTETRMFQFAWTGKEAPEKGRFLATVQTNGGNLVWHLYEVTEGVDA